MSAYRSTHNDVCGLYFLNPSHQTSSFFGPPPGIPQYLPLISLSAHATILSTVSQTKLTQTFFNPAPGPISAHYIFPLYDGISIVGFTCTINNERVIRGSVQEKQKARQAFNDAVARGETAGLLEQLPDAGDVFNTMVGNVPAGAEIKVDIVVLGELKHDAEVDGVRYTLPTRVAPRYGGATFGQFQQSPLQVGSCLGISITVDVEMQSGSVVPSLISPSHPVAITIGSTSSNRALSNMGTQKASTSSQFDVTMHQPQLASATLSLGTTFLDKDFVLQINATKISDPVAILETHPTMPNQRALMTTLVPKFNLPSERPEIVFVCDQSGSMEGQKIANLKSALQLFLKSLPVGVKFNICSFGSHHSFLFPEGSRTYDADSLDAAMQSVRNMQPNYGGTEIYAPIEATFDKRDTSLDLEVFVLTDGQVWNQNPIFDMVNSRQDKAKGTFRLFTLGIGDGASSALIEGLSRAGNGFAQTVSDSEKLNRKVIRMLKAALTPHLSDYTLEIKYRQTDLPGPDEEKGGDFELVSDIDLVDSSASPIDETASEPSLNQKDPISFYDTSVNPDENSEISSDLPKTPIPKILQTPFQISPLFPFNRTSIFMLFSPEAADKAPETVTLRAMSKHGPLILDIPVTTPINPTGEVIHQLAARKAALELEEGRGWIFHATHESVSLKEAYPHEFHSMVEREAVRLGVKFQVGGKWCSFVAVNEGGEVLNTTSAPETRASTTNSSYNIPSMAIMASTNNVPSLFGSISSAAPIEMSSQCPGNVFGSVSASPSAAPNQGHHASLFGQAVSGGSLFPAQPPSQNSTFGSKSNSLFGGSMAARSTAMMGGGMGCSPSTSAQNQAGGISGSKPATQHTYGIFGGVGGPVVPGPSAHQAMSTPHGGLFGQQAAAAQTPGKSHKKIAKMKRAGGRSDLAEPRTRKSVPDLTGQSLPAAAQETPLEAVVSLQNFAGYWAWADGVFGLIGVDQEKLVTNEINTSPDAWATIAVLAFMRKKLAAEKDTWELLEEKAMAWLSTQMGPDENAKLEVMIDTIGQQLR